MLIFTILASFWLEIFLKVGVIRQIRRALLSVAPVALLFLIWDAYALAHDQWRFDSKRVLGLYLPFQIPLEEFFFFLVVPIATIMTIEAVRKVKKQWLVGDEK